MLAWLLGGTSLSLAADKVDYVDHPQAQAFIQEMVSQHDFDPAYLREARRLLDELLSKNPKEHHESMLTNVRVNREIVAACRAESGEGDSASDNHDDEPRGTESITRAG